MAVMRARRYKMAHAHAHEDFALVRVRLPTRPHAHASRRQSWRPGRRRGRRGSVGAGNGGVHCDSASSAAPRLTMPIWISGTMPIFAASPEAYPMATWRSSVCHREFPEDESKGQNQTWLAKTTGVCDSANYWSCFCRCTARIWIVLRNAA